MGSERFRLRTTSDWKSYGIFLILGGVLVVSAGLTVPPRLENIAIGLGGLALFAACFTPLVILGTLPGGNWIELGPERIRIKRWWISGLDVDYCDILEIRAPIRHNPIMAYVVSKSAAALEEHVDLVIRLTTVRGAWRMRGWLSFGNVLHLSSAEAGSFVAALQPHLHGHEL